MLPDAMEVSRKRWAMNKCNTNSKLMKFAEKNQFKSIYIRFITPKKQQK